MPKSVGAAKSSDVGTDLLSRTRHCRLTDLAEGLENVD